MVLVVIASACRDRVGHGAAERIPYGAAAQQYGELRLPAGDGPFATAVLLHGGCWRSAYGAGDLAPLAEAIREFGVASWNLEYRRVDDDGGGWPGTFLDVGAGIDRLGELAPRHRLDLDRVVVIGHSAGGQLALWAAARPRLPAASVIRGTTPLPLRGVIALGAITDLARFRGADSGECGAAVDLLLDGPPTQWPHRYAQTSPAALLPLGIRQWFLHGERDAIVSSASVRRHVAAARAAGDIVALVVNPDAGHFEPVLVGSSMWPALRSAIAEALAQ